MRGEEETQEKGEAVESEGVEEGDKKDKSSRRRKEVAAAATKGRGRRKGPSLHARPPALTQGTRAHYPAPSRSGRRPG